MLSARGRALALGLFTLRAGWSGQLADQGLAPFSRMIDGTAARPFVHRLLLPSVARGLHALLPAPLRDSPAHTVEVALALLLVFACFFGFAFVLRRLLDACYAVPEAVRRWAPAAALLALINLVGVFRKGDARATISRAVLAKIGLFSAVIGLYLVLLKVAGFAAATFVALLLLLKVTKTKGWLLPVLVAGGVAVGAKLTFGYLGVIFP